MDIKKKFEYLRGKPITTAEIQQKYKVYSQLVLVWVRLGYIKILKAGYRQELDEADVAYCAHIYHDHKRKGIKAPLFDEAHRPYQLKQPALHEYRRKKKLTT